MRGGEVWVENTALLRIRGESNSRASRFIGSSKTYGVKMMLRTA